MALTLRPVSFAQARAFVQELHRHNKPPVGHKFSVGVEDDGKLVGVAMAGRPIARGYDDGLTLEVNRTCTDGTRNANSMLYGAVWRAAKALGYRRLITYTQADESGASLRAVGWRMLAIRPARASWAQSTKIESLRAKRCPIGNGGVERRLWGVGEFTTPLPELAHS